MSTVLRQTPLYSAHLGLAGRIVEFAGWAMPVFYTGILEEARAVRNSTGMFDISHMGRVRIKGGGAVAFLQKLTSNNVERLSASEAQYSLLTNLNGGIIDDIIVYRESTDSFLVVINAGNTPKDMEWIRAQQTDGVEIEDLTDLTAMIAVQGPAAVALVSSIASEPGLQEMKRFQYCKNQIAGISAICCRTGYTGEDGFELIVDAGSALILWEALREQRALPCGLGARDALRIEAGYPLYGHEIDEETSPVEAGLMWVVDLTKGEFTGSDIIRAKKAAGPARRLVGLTLTERIIPRQGYTIHVGDALVGIITSGVFSPTLGHSIAMAYVDKPYSETGQSVAIAIRDKMASATVIPKKSLLTV